MRLLFRETLLAFRRAPTLSALSVTTIGFALFVVGLFALVALNIRSTIETVEARVEIMVYLKRGTPIETITLGIADIESFPEVQMVTYVSEEEALERARQELVEFQGVFDDLRRNPLPASLEIALRPGFRDSPSVARVAERLQGFVFADDIRYGREWIAKLDRLRYITGIVVLVIGAAFAAAAVVIIGTTVRMTVLQRAREINIMRLVGATDGFVRRPFLVEGILKGSLGGVLALLLNYVTYLTVNQTLLRTEFFNLPEAAGMILAGAVLGLAASATSLSRHLKQV